jgi:hypothetical protein
VHSNALKSEMREETRYETTSKSFEVMHCVRQ